MSSNLTVQGLRIKDSPQFNFRFDNCKKVHVESIHITAPALSPNTDGIHIENTNAVEIYNSVISNGVTPNFLNLLQFLISYSLDHNLIKLFVYCLFLGDDCVSIGSGCYDVDIKNITCGPGHGIR